MYFVLIDSVLVVVRVVGVKRVSWDVNNRFYQQLWGFIGGIWCFFFFKLLDRVNNKL